MLFDRKDGNLNHYLYEDYENNRKKPMIRQWKCSVPNCRYDRPTYCNYYEMYDHIINLHLPSCRSKIFKDKCRICLSKFSNMFFKTGEVVQHFFTSHTTLFFYCTACRGRYSDLETFTYHINRSKTRWMKDNKCIVCLREIKSPCIYRFHRAFKCRFLMNR